MRSAASIAPTLRRLTLRTGLYRSLKGPIDGVWYRSRRRRGTFSQHGEDRELLARLGPTGLYADVGANHVFKGNNTFLLYRSGWRGLTMEPIKSLCVQHRKTRPNDVCVNAAAGRNRESRLFHELSPSGFSTFDGASAEKLVADHRAVEVEQYDVPIIPLAHAWEKAFGARRPDFVSIDTEGFELEVLAGADLARLQPAFVLLEFTAAVDDGRRSTLIDVMQDAGYFLTAEFGVNGLFERSPSA